MTKTDSYFNISTLVSPGLSRLLYFLIGLLILSSCSRRNLAYFSDLEEKGVYTEAIGSVEEPKIKPDDLLSITVSSLNPEANLLFNVGSVPSEAKESVSLAQQGYLVNQEGFIDFPVLGKVEVGGLTKEEVKNKLVAQLAEYLKDPIVNIRYLNYRITVIGEVTRPSSFTIPSEKINILTALGMAGDLTPFGKRENVLIIREEKGVRTMSRINLNNKDVLNSPYFYLQQNDVVYVEPVSSKSPEFGNNLRYISIAVSILSVISLLLIRINTN